MARNLSPAGIPVLILVGLVLSCALAVFLGLPTSREFAVGLGSFIWFSLSSSLYYHRVLTHKSAKLVLPLEIFFLIGGLIGLSGDPLQWAAIHRFHHSHSDHDDDIHSPRHGLWWSFFGWYLRIRPENFSHVAYLSQSLLEDRPWLNKSEGTLPSFVAWLTAALILLSWHGLHGFVYGLQIPILLSFLSAWALIASLAHTPGLGRQDFSETKDRSRNLVWLAPLTFGESLHNTHHRYPMSAVLSRHFYEVDLSGWLILLFEKIGLAHEVKNFSREREQISLAEKAEPVVNSELQL